MSWTEIGLFQLENLALTPARFLYFDLRSERKDLPAPLGALLKRAQPLSPTGAEHMIEKTSGGDKTAPILLVCENGTDSAALARRLSQLGYEQIYVVAGGVQALLSEA